MLKSILTLPSPITLLIAAAVLGSTLGLIEGRGSAMDLRLDPHAAALYAAEINGIPILYKDYQRALSLFAQDKRDPLNIEDRELVFERLIQEELLVQQAVSSDLMRSDRRLRSAVLQSMIAGLDIESRSKHSPEAANGGLETYLTQLRESASIQRELLQ
jgi:hypothetical protein